MLQTNFIAARAQRRRQAERLAGAGRWVVLVAALLLLLPPLHLTGLASARAKALLNLRHARERVAEDAAENLRLSAELKRLKPVHDLAVGVHGSDALWLDLLKELRDRLPSGVWYTRVNVTRPWGDAKQGQRQTLYLSGAAEQHEAIGQYLEALNQSPWLELAVLTRSGPVQAMEGPFEFELQATLRRVIPAEGTGQRR